MLPSPTITKYRFHHKVVHIVSTDHESVLKSENTPEQSMRVVREKMEAKIYQLPYNLLSDLYDYLAQDVVNQCNPTCILLLMK